MRARLLTALAALLAVAAACSSSSNSGAPAAKAATTTAPSTSTSPPAPAGTAVTSSWPTYHHDAARSGYDPSASPSSRPATKWTVSLDGEVLAEPLLVGSEVVVATEDDVVAAYDASTGAARWSTKLGQPVPGSSLPCGDIDPSGITSTPVVDPSTGTIWVVAFLQPGHHELFALDATTGAVRASRNADPPGASPLVEQQRAALALSGGVVYIPYGGLFGDCGDYHGYVLGFPTQASGATSTYRVPATSQAGIWAPPGAAVATDGSLLVATGNGTPSAASSQTDSVVRLSPNLSVLDSFAPPDFATLDSNDLDLGSTGPALVPGGLVFQVGKSGVAYVLRADHLGGVGGQAASLNICQGAFGAVSVGPPPAGSSLTATIVVPCDSGLVGLGVAAPNRLSVLWSRSGLEAGPPVQSRNTVFLLDRRQGALLSLDPATGSTIASAPVGQANRFVTPTLGPNLVYVTAGSKLLALG